MLEAPPVLSGAPPDAAGGGRGCGGPIAFQLLHPSPLVVLREAEASHVAGVEESVVGRYQIQLRGFWLVLIVTMETPITQPSRSRRRLSVEHGLL